MEKEENNNSNNNNSNNNRSKSSEPEFVFQWGKRLRCVRVKDPSKPNPTSSIRQKITSKVVTDPTFIPLNPTNTRGTTDGSGSAKSPERYYTTRGSEERENLKMEKNNEGNENGKGNLVWPKLYISLSSKEKEEDFLAMKGCKLPQRPKKRAKFIQRTLLFVSPGAWLTDMCQERYEVREKKTPKKRPTGLKAMGGLHSDSE